MKCTYSISIGNEFEVHVFPFDLHLLHGFFKPKFFAGSSADFIKPSEKEIQQLTSKGQLRIAWSIPLSSSKKGFQGDRHMDTCQIKDKVIDSFTLCVVHLALYQQFIPFLAFT